MATETRVCTGCGNEYPLTAEHWHRRRDRFQARCKSCASAQAREYMRKRRAANPEYDRERYAANPEYYKKYRAANRETKRQYAREYRAANREALNQRARERYAASRGCVRKYRRCRPVVRGDAR